MTWRRRPLDGDRRYRGIFDQALAGMAIMDVDGTVACVNAALCRLLGRDEAELLGLTLAELGHPDDERDAEELRRVLAGDVDGLQGQRRLLHTDGSVVHVAISASLVRGEAGQPDQFVAHLIDVTAPVESRQSPRGSEGQFPGLFDNTRVGMVLTTPDRRLLRVNRATCDLLGYDADELTTRTWEEVTHPDDSGDSEGLVRACLDGEIPGFSLDQRFLHADGHVVTVSLVTSLVSDETGRPLHFATQMVDIKERRTLHQQLRGQPYQCARILEGLSELGEGVVVYDGERIVYANDALCDVSGYTRDELLAMDAVAQLVVSSETEETRALEDGGNLSRGTLSLRRRDASVAPAEFATVPLKLDGHVGQLTIIRDLSQRLRAIAELQTASQLKTDLLAMLSHDIGQPLTAIRGYAKLLVDKWPATTDESRLMMLGQMRVSAERMGGMVTQILAMGRAEGQGMVAERDPVSVGDAIQQSVAHLTDAVPGIVVTDASAAAVLVDPGHLQQMLVNLMSNAGKYGRPPIHVETRTTAQGWVEIRVRDHGAGVPAEFIPKLFDRYARVDEHDETGTGLGLFIVRRLAQANGGQIRYDPESRSGACFVLTLPAVDSVQQTVLSQMAVAAAQE